MKKQIAKNIQQQLRLSQVSNQKLHKNAKLTKNSNKPHEYHGYEVDQHDSNNFI